MTNTDKLVKRARKLLKALNFDECLELYDKLDAGSPMMDLLFERMEDLDPVRFERWMD